MRKNIHLSSEVIAFIGDVWHDARFKSETAAVVALLEGAADRLSQADGYVYLARRGNELKIGYSKSPTQRVAKLKASILTCVSGDRLTKLAAHILWGKYRVHGEWFSDAPEIISWFSSHPMLVDTTENESRYERITVLLTKSERAKMQAGADKAGLDGSTFIRVLALEAIGEIKFLNVETC